jgi:hypothetical protein
VIVDETFNIPHDLGVATTDILSHNFKRLGLIVLVVCSRRLRVENKWDC